MRVLDNAHVYRFEPRSSRFVRHHGLVIGDDGRIASLDPSEAGPEVPRSDFAGATVLPAFADCHVHLTDTGYFLGERDLSAVTTYDEFVAAVSRVPGDGGIAFAGQYDDAKWRDGSIADAAPLERFHGARRAMLARVDGHSCVVNRATLAWLDLPHGAEGIERDEAGAPTGRLTLDANWSAQRRFLAEIPLSQRRSAERRAVELALTRGALHLHAQLYGFAREQYEREIRSLRALPARIYPKVCEMDPALAVELGLPYIGGDIFLDGSIGSRTAAMCEPYADAAASGALEHSTQRLEAFFRECERLGIGAGVHAIGDAAIEQCVAAWGRVLRDAPSASGARHFIEHFECARSEHVEACARMGIVLSMQPLFDARWGGSGGMYETRLGAERARRMNALASVVRSGAILCGGDDAPVCALDPLLGMQACLDHHEEGERLDAHEALAAYTVAAAYLACAEHETGNIAPGLAADLVVLDRDPFDGTPFAQCTILQTWRDGEPVYVR